MLDYRSVNTTKKVHNFITNQVMTQPCPFFYPLVSWRSRKTKVTNNQPLSKKGHVTPPSQKGHVAWITRNRSLLQNHRKNTPTARPAEPKSTKMGSIRSDKSTFSGRMSLVFFCLTKKSDLNPSTRVHFPYFFCGPGFRLGNYTVHFPHLFVETWV